MSTQVHCQPWSGFIHAGGVLADGLVPKQTAASLRAAFGPKVSFIPFDHIYVPHRMYAGRFLL